MEGLLLTGPTPSSFFGFGMQYFDRLDSGYTSNGEEQLLCIEVLRGKIADFVLLVTCSSIKNNDLSSNMFFLIFLFSFLN